jgi:hypothetical protein
MNYLAVISILSLIFCAGCIGTPPVPEPLPTAVITPEPPTPVPTPAITTTAPTPTPVPTIPPAEIPPEPTEPDPIPVPTPMPPTANITEGMKWQNFSSSDFKLQYPDGWEMENDTFETWSNRVVSTPDLYQKEGRQIKFISPNLRTWFTAKLWDYIVPGGHTLNQDIKYVQNEITATCPDVDGFHAVSNYKYMLDDSKYMVMSYDVIIPVTSNCSPMQYSERKFVTYHRMYQFRFATMEGSLDEYRDLKDTMMKSIVPESQDSFTSAYGIY